MSGLTVDATGNDLTYRIIGAAMVVHRALGPGYQEQIYERALAVELDKLGIKAKRQSSYELKHEGIVVASFHLDLLVDDQVVVEVKAFKRALSEEDRAQVISYLKATGAPVGLLFNFGRPSLEYHRIFPGKNSPRDHRRL